MLTQEGATIKRHCQELDFALAVYSKGQWTVRDRCDPKAPERNLGWLLFELSLSEESQEIERADVMSAGLADALHLPQGRDGITWAYGLRLVRRNLNRLGLMLARS